MERFVIQQNIEHYRALLEITTGGAGCSRNCFSKKRRARLKKYDDAHKKK